MISLSNAASGPQGLDKNTHAGRADSDRTSCPSRWLKLAARDSSSAGGVYTEHRPGRARADSEAAWWLEELPVRVTRHGVAPMLSWAHASLSRPS